MWLMYRIYLYFDETSASSTEIDIHMEEIQEEIVKWKFFLMGNILGAKPSLKIVSEFVQKQWNFGPLPLVQYFKKRWFSFKFETEEAMNAFLREGPWKIGANSLILKQWTPCFSCTMERVAIVPTWIYLFPDFVPYMWTDSILSRMASKIGKPLFADLHTTCKAGLSFARILVEVNISKELPNHVIINTPFLGKSTQRIVKVALSAWKVYIPTPKEGVVVPKEGVTAPKEGANKKKRKQIYRPVNVGRSVTDPSTQAPASECHLLGGTSTPKVDKPVALKDGVNSECHKLGSPNLDKPSTSSPQVVVMHSGCSVLGQALCLETINSQVASTSVVPPDQTDTMAQEILSPNRFSVLDLSEEVLTAGPIEVIPLDEDPLDNKHHTIISSWNIRGLNKLAKQIEVGKYFKDNKVDILGVLETRVK
ncbi:uncharacterized protein LOC141643494 [Silene latifolia]|uniref:uncharacterized protein LOC141643494 n=1 Tax=Silene latifolia TaxID=37657 RepID=UPI003D775991